MCKISERNDKLRTSLTPDPRNRIMLTASVKESPEKNRVLSEVKSFSNFTPENDPYGEHDFGAVEIEGTKYFFKFDYYDHNLEYGADPKTDDYTLVLTIMEARDY